MASMMDSADMALQGVRAAASLAGPGLAASKQQPGDEDAMNDPVVVNFIEFYYKGESRAFFWRLWGTRVGRPLDEREGSEKTS